MQVKDPKEVKERTAPQNLFQREKQITINDVTFKLKRMTLREELEWYGERDEIMQDKNLSNRDKIILVWERLLRKVIVEPKLESYTEELPATVVARLIDEITKLHLWDMDFTRYKQGLS